MTLLAILADIHGNLPALEAVCAELRGINVDHVIVAGDLINWGPFSREVVQLVSDAKWAVIRGNSEYYLLDFDTSRAPPEWDSFSLLPWLSEQVSGHWRNVIAAWPDALSLRYPDADPVLVVHGVPNDPWVGVFPTTTETEIETLFEQVQELTVVTAHTHLPMERRVGRWTILNPGSVGGPVQGNVVASFMLLEARKGAWIPTFRSVSYSTTRILSEFVRQGFVSRCGPIAKLIIREFETAQLVVIPYLRWHASNCPDVPPTEETIAAFTDEQRIAYTPAHYQSCQYSDNRV